MSCHQEESAMNITPVLSDYAAKKISELLSMTDSAFFHAHLTSLTPKELEDFLRECPEFLEMP